MVKRMCENACHTYFQILQYRLCNDEIGDGNGYGYGTDIMRHVVKDMDVAKDGSYV